MTGMDEAKKIAQILDSKKAEELRVLKVDEMTALTDYFVIATGMSNTHVKSLADEVQYQMDKLGIESRLEGKATDWILLDYLLHGRTQVFSMQKIIQINRNSMDLWNSLIHQVQVCMLDILRHIQVLRLFQEKEEWKATMYFTL